MNSTLNDVSQLCQGHPPEKLTPVQVHLNRLKFGAHVEAVVKFSSRYPDV